VLGDKRDHIDSMKDVWEMFRVILDERKKREIDPTIRLLRECVAEAAHTKQRDAYVLQRLKALDEFFTQTGNWYAEVRSWPMSGIVRFLKLASKARKLLGIG
jgi:DNA-binding transcriptional regulator GbsR (MarR family)